METIDVCCILQNIVIDMEELEEEEVAGMEEETYIEQVRQVADEDAVRVRDILSQHLTGSGVHTTAAEEKKEAAAVVSSVPGDENKEQQAQRRQASDRGKEKAHDN